MHPVIVAGQRWIAVAVQHYDEAEGRLGECLRETPNRDELEVALTATQISLKILRRLESVRAMLLMDAPPEDVMTQIEAAGIEAINDLVNAHADPASPLGASWDVEKHIRATAAARVVQGSRWTLCDIKKAPAPIEADGGYPA